MTKVANLLVMASLFMAAAVGPASAQFPGGLKYAVTSASISPSTATPGRSATIDVTIKVAAGFHINSVKPNDPDLIATSVTASSANGLMFGAAVYPPAKTISAPSLSQAPLSVYTGTNIIRVSVKVPRMAKPGVYVVPLTVVYQGCNASACFPPKTDSLSATLIVK